MRFPLKYALWVLFVYVAIFSLFAPTVRTHWDARRYFASTSNDLRQIVTAAKEYDFTNSQPHNLEFVMQRSLDQGRLPVKSGGTIAFKFDRWGRAYQFTKLPPMAGGTSAEYGAFSLGMDGVSNSLGNDADDINSWGRAPSLVYQSEIDRAMRGKGVLWALTIATLLAFGPLLLRGMTAQVADPY